MRTRNGILIVDSPGATIPVSWSVRGLISGEEFAAKDRDRLPGQSDPLAVEAHTQGAAARRDLPRDELGLAQAFRPVGREAAMRGSGHGIFVDPRSRREES